MNCRTHTTYLSILLFSINTVLLLSGHRAEAQPPEVLWAEIDKFECRYLLIAARQDPYKRWVWESFGATTDEIAAIERQNKLAAKACQSGDFREKVEQFEAQVKIANRIAERFGRMVNLPGSFVFSSLADRLARSGHDHKENCKTKKITDAWKMPKATFRSSFNAFAIGQCNNTDPPESPFAKNLKVLSGSVSACMDKQLENVMHRPSNECDPTMAEKKKGKKKGKGKKKKKKTKEEKSAWKCSTSDSGNQVCTRQEQTTHKKTKNKTVKKRTVLCSGKCNCGGECNGKKGEIENVKRSVAVGLHIDQLGAPLSAFALHDGLLGSWENKIPLDDDAYGWVEDLAEEDWFGGSKLCMQTNLAAGLNVQYLVTSESLGHSPWNPPVPPRPGEEPEKHKLPLTIGHAFDQCTCLATKEAMGIKAHPAALRTTCFPKEDAERIECLRDPVGMDALICAQHAKADLKRIAKDVCPEVLCPPGGVTAELKFGNQKRCGCVSNVFLQGAFKGRQRNHCSTILCPEGACICNENGCGCNNAGLMGMDPSGLPQPKDLLDLLDQDPGEIQ